MSPPLLVVAGHPLGLFEVAVIGGLLLLAVVVAFAWRASNARAEVEAAAAERVRELEDRLAAMTLAQAEVSGRVKAMGESLGERQGDVQRAVSERLDAVSHRLGQSMLEATRFTTDNLAKLNERLAVIDAARQTIGALSAEVGGLKAILSNKQARGAFGQARMEAIVRDGLPGGTFEFQATLRNGRRPDCLVALPNTPERLVVDAKFPLEAMVAFRAASNDAERKAAVQRVRADIGRHIDDIAEKYFVPGETQDLALLFVPAESVFADLSEHFDEIIQKAFKARVVLVSPALLMMAVQVMQALVRDERLRDEARLIRTEVGHLVEDVRRLRERAVALEKHFGQVSEDVAKILVSSEKVLRRGARIEAVDLPETQPRLAAE